MYTKPDDFILSDDMITSDESYSAFFRDAILQFGIGFCFLVIIVQSGCFKDKGNFQSIPPFFFLDFVSVNDAYATGMSMASKELEFSCVSFDLYETLPGCTPKKRLRKR